jgi:nucleotide-binding universal stress UspA family protein
MAAAKEAMKEYQSQVPEGSNIECEVISGQRIPDAINHYAAAHDVDLIALSTHGRTGWRHLALGSVAEAVLRQAEVPVITFPRKKEK